MARVSVVYQVYQRYNEALEWLEIRLSVPVKVWRSAGAPHPLWSLALGREIRCRDSMVEPCLTYQLSKTCSLGLRISSHVFDFFLSLSPSLSLWRPFDRPSVSLLLSYRCLSSPYPVLHIHGSHAAVHRASNSHWPVPAPCAWFVAGLWIGKPGSKEILSHDRSTVPSDSILQDSKNLM